MKKTLLTVLAVSIIILISTFQAAACDKAAAKNVMSLMNPMIQSVETDAGWTIITFGSDYFSWTDRQTEGIVTTYANADACLTGKARKLEFRSPSGKLVARADSFRGIQMK